MLYLESGGHAIRSVGVVIADTAGGADRTENAGGGLKGRTLPPNGIRVGIIMLIFHLAVSGRVIGILFKIVGLLR